MQLGLTRLKLFSNQTQFITAISRTLTYTSPPDLWISRRSSYGKQRQKKFYKQPPFWLHSSKKYLLQLVEYKILTSKNMFSKTTHMSCTGRPQICITVLLPGGLLVLGSLLGTTILLPCVPSSTFLDQFPSFSTPYHLPNFAVCECSRNQA